MLDAPMFGARWRWNATRALAILRMRGGKKVAPQLQRMRADDLLAACLPDASGVRGEPHRADPHPRSRAGARDDRQLLARGDGPRRPDCACCERSRAARSARSPSTRPNRRRSATRSSTRTRTPTSTTRRSKSAARAPCRCAARLRSDAGRQRHPRSGRDRRSDRSVLAAGSRRRRAARRAGDAVVLPPVPDWRAWFDELVAQRRATTLSCRRRPDGAPRVLDAAPNGSTSRASRIRERVVEPEIAARCRPRTRCRSAREDAFAEILRGWLESTGPAHRRGARRSALPSTPRRSRSR